MLRPLMQPRAHDYPLLIRESHLDTFGHVNNASYLQIFEEARWDWITSGGYGLSRIAQTQQGPVVLECTAKFRRELSNRQRVVVRSWVHSYVGKIGHVRQDLFIVEDGTTPQLSCEATFVMAFFDLQARKLLPPNAAWLACLGLNPNQWQPGPAGR